MDDIYPVLSRDREVPAAGVHTRAGIAARSRVDPDWYSSTKQPGARWLSDRYRLCRLDIRRCWYRSSRRAPGLLAAIEHGESNGHDDQL
jgi:hypothetical protein